MITCVWLNQSVDPHYGGHRDADRSALAVLDTLAGHQATVLTDCLPDLYETGIEIVPVESLGGNPYCDRWRHLDAWLQGRTDFVWSVDANDVRLLNDPYPDWLRDDVLYVGSEPADGPDARSVGFWWMRGLHPAHGEWIDAHADLPLLNAGLLGGSAAVLAEFTGELLPGLADADDVTDMAAINQLLYERWADRIVTGPTVHSPMWSYCTDHPTAIWAHK